MLSSEVIKKIEEFVYKKPRSVQEISNHIGKNWRTVDRYIQEIKENFGTLDIRIFRGGTRGALKIVYWASLDKMGSSVFQEKLANEIKTLKRKEDFSAFDIYQHVENKNKTASLKQTEEEAKTNLKELREILNRAESQLLAFSGNLSWINLEDGNIKIFEKLEELVKKGINIKLLCRVDLVSLDNIEKLLSLNHKYGKEVIEIHHCEQPLRALIIDNKIMRLKEVKEPTGKINELNKKIYLFYTIKDKDWVEWVGKIFWNLFSNSIDSKKRITELRNLK